MGKNVYIVQKGKKFVSASDIRSGRGNFVAVLKSRTKARQLAKKGKNRKVVAVSKEHLLRRLARLH